MFELKTSDLVIHALLVLTAVATVAVMSGCSGKEINLPFETIERADSPGTGQNYEGKEPELVIITETAKINSLGNAISVNAQAQVRNLDFGQYLAIAVFQGLKGSGGYSAEIRRVTRKGDAIIVYAHFAERDPQRVASDVMTSPYHLVKVQKLGLRGNTEFILNVDGASVSQQTHAVP